MADPDLQIRGEGGTVNQTLRGTPVTKKYFFGPVWFKNKGGAGPPSLSPGSVTGSIRRPRDFPAVFCKT